MVKHFKLEIYHFSHPERQTDIRPQANENLPFYLQDVEKFNPELMTAAKTEVHLSLPTMTGEQGLRLASCIITQRTACCVFIETLVNQG